MYIHKYIFFNDLAASYFPPPACFIIALLFLNGKMQIIGYVSIILSDRVNLHGLTPMISS